MARLVSVFISATYRRFLAVVVWALVFTLAVAALAAFGLYQTGDSVRANSRLATEHFMRLRVDLLSTMDVMHEELTAQPCSAAFSEQLRTIAYRPDGLNEFLYAPGGIVQCSVNNNLAAGYDLGSPDIAITAAPYISFWMDRELDFLGLPGQRGTIVLKEPFAAIIPPPRFRPTTPDWLSLEIVAVSPDGRWWHRGGAAGVYGANLATEGRGILPSLFQGELRKTVCDPMGLHCIATQTRLGALIATQTIAVLLGLIMAAVVASFVARHVDRLIERYWSFEARFRRHLDDTSIVCAYQPVMHLDTGDITGCEVLARWRDVDDRLVYPDRFIHLLQRNGLTLTFTEHVARRAFAELCAAVPEGKRLQVNFNIFPCDLDSEKLARVFGDFTTQPDRFDLVLEIIESDDIPPNAQREIDALRRAGIKTYIDDFGTGYSNMQNLAALSVDGVKLDRAFAMAPDNSMMAQMLRHAVEMIHATGRVMVVEGVETAERLALLRRMQARIDFVQGYLISRPLDIVGFADFITKKPISLAEHKRETELAIKAG
ncbi:EAL domain-containing protein [Mesorhizobium sp. CAU 1732]|uniref:EAL domain-containing protein n=1 Tax=Mesorhizobium sp. CAU 1732 TaxID=3140358 RepID=UPI00325FFFF1